MAKLYYIVFASLLSLTLHAHKIDLKVVKHKDNSMSVFVSGYTHGYMSYEFTFHHMENYMGDSRMVASIYGEGEVMRLYPRDKTLSISYSLCKVNSKKGKLDASPNTKIIYRLPYSERDSAQGVMLGSVRDNYLEEDGDINYAAFCFQLKQGDTIFAMRRGRVVEINNQYSESKLDGKTLTCNSLLIEHIDGTVSKYRLLQQNSFMVQEGDEVLPGTPLALVGSLSPTNHQVRVSVYSIVCNNNYGNSGKLLQNNYITPRFATQRGIETIYKGRFYRTQCTEEMIMAEMSKKERKKYQEMKGLQSKQTSSQ